jgi:hypothetical protein
VWRAERPNHSAPRIATSEEGVPAIFGGVVSLSLINSFATNRTKPNVTHQPPFHTLRKRTPNPSFLWHRAHLFMAISLRLRMPSSASVRSFGDARDTLMNLGRLSTMVFTKTRTPPEPKGGVGYAVSLYRPQRRFTVPNFPIARPAR